MVGLYSIYRAIASGMTFFEWLRRVDFAEIDIALSAMDNGGGQADQKEKITSKIECLGQTIPGAELKKMNREELERYLQDVRDGKI